MSGLPVADAARALGVSPGTLRRWVSEGCPVARRGRRGRGCRTLVDPGAVRAWRDAGTGQKIEAAFHELAGRLPELMGEAMAEAHRAAPDKRNSAWVAVAGWQLAVGATLDHMREQVPGLPDPNVPEAIELLRKIAVR